MVVVVVGEEGLILVIEWKGGGRKEGFYNFFGWIR